MRPRVTVTTNVLGNAPYQLDSPPDYAEGAGRDSLGMGTEIYCSVGRSWSYCENLRSEMGVQWCRNPRHPTTRFGSAKLYLSKFAVRKVSVSGWCATDPGGEEGLQCGRWLFRIFLNSHGTEFCRAHNIHPTGNWCIRVEIYALRATRRLPYPNSWGWAPGEMVGNDPQFYPDNLDIAHGKGPRCSLEQAIDAQLDAWDSQSSPQTCLMA